MTSHDTRDPAAERLAEMVEIQRYLDDGSIHPRLADDLRDLTAFAGEVLALTETAEKSDVCQHDQVCAFAIRDAAARHLGGQ